MDRRKQLRVGFVGAGIGGLAAAIAVAQAGAEVTVLESAEELGEVCWLPSILLLHNGD
jgi:salicylate hydroxylase